MRKAGVIGHPISHSKSPFIHGHWLSKYGIDGEYKTYDIAPENLEAGIRELVALGLSGFNVTLPHKQKIIPFCKTLSDEARAIGAVNTVTIDANGDLHGHNTDAFGFAENLNQNIPNFEWASSRVLVIGAGGAARAIVYALSKNDVASITITNRTLESAEELAKIYGANVVDWSKRHSAVEGIDLIINTTSLGMKGQANLDIDLSALNQNAVVYDIVYVPLMTPLLQQAQSVGAKVVTGIGMLLHQARPGFEQWFGKYPDVTVELEKTILDIK